jgi:short-subunit dehydrogenase
LALVTGTSSGIGRAFVRRLGSDGYDLVVVGRRRDRLEELVVAVRPLVADLGTDAGVKAVAELCAIENLSMLVNNAGVAHYMPFAKLPADKADELLHVKVVAPTMLTRAAVPRMLERGEGTIVNVSGMLAFSGPASLQTLPLRRAVYTATLAHVVALSQALHEELKSHGVRVQALCPGVVATEFHERQGLDLSAVPRMSRKTS